MPVEYWQCPVCNRSHFDNLDFRLLYPNGPLGFYSCSCGLKYSDYALYRYCPDIYTKKYFDSIRFNSVGKLAYINHLSCFFEKIANLYHFKNKRLLDIGCATGDFVAYAIEKGWNAEGIDISRTAISIGQSRGLPVRQCSIESLSETEIKYDVITLWDVLEHLSNVKYALQIIRHSLKDRGLFFLKTVSSTSLIEKLARLMLRMSYGKIDDPIKRIYVPGHLYFFTEATIKQLLMNENWKILTMEKTDTPPMALFKSKIMRFCFRVITVMQNITGLSYEFMIACKPTIHPLPSKNQ